MVDEDEKTNNLIPRRFYVLWYITELMVCKTHSAKTRLNSRASHKNGTVCQRLNKRQG